MGEMQHIPLSRRLGRSLQTMIRLGRSVNTMICHPKFEFHCLAWEYQLCVLSWKRSDLPIPVALPFIPSLMHIASRAEAASHMLYHVL